MSKFRFRFTVPALAGLAAAVTITIALVLSPAPARAHDGVHVEEPWARATLGATRTGAGYARIVNHSDKAERLVSARSPAAGRVEIHEMAMSGSTMVMRPLPRGLDVKGKETVELKPGGFHLMFVDLKGPFVAGKKIPVTLVFEREGEVQIELDVRDARGGAPAPGAHSH